MGLAGQLISMYESAHLADVNKGKLLTKPKTQNIDIPCMAKFTFDLAAMIPFKLNSEMDVHDLVDDLISDADIEQKIEAQINAEMKKQEWFNEKFEYVDATIDGVDHGGKIQNLNAVAITVKLNFRTKVSVEENKLATALTNIMPNLKNDLQKSASKMEAEKY